jgi:hypothetical protein
MGRLSFHPIAPLEYMNSNTNLPPGCLASDIEGASADCDCGEPATWVLESEGTALGDRYYCEDCAIAAPVEAS